MKKTELAVMKDFNVVTGYEDMDPELMEELKDEMEDLDDERGIACRQIKIPSGGGKAFEIESDDPNDPEVEKEIQGVVIFTHRLNSFWDGEFGSEDGNRAPTCSAIDAKKGVNIESGEIRECENCPLNQFKADGSGKDCKNMRRIYLLRSGHPEIYMLSIPPTSIKDINKQLARIMGVQKIPYTRMVVTFKLEVAKNKSGIAYSKVTVERSGLLSDDLYAKTAAMRRELKEKYKDVAITTEDYKTVAATDDGFIEVPEGEEPAVFN